MDGYLDGWVLDWWMDWLLDEWRDGWIGGVGVGVCWWNLGQTEFECIDGFLCKVIWLRMKECMWMTEMHRSDCWWFVRCFVFTLLQPRRKHELIFLINLYAEFNLIFRIICKAALQNYIKFIAFPHRSQNLATRFCNSYRSTQILNSIIQFYSLNT